MKPKRPKLPAAIPSTSALTKAYMLSPAFIFHGSLREGKSTLT
jgi:hypothetical protein